MNGTQQGNANWETTVKLVPRYTLVKEYTLSGSPSVFHTDNYTYNRTDMTMSVMKNGVKTIDEYIINSNIGADMGGKTIPLIFSMMLTD